MSSPKKLKLDLTDIQSELTSNVKPSLNSLPHIPVLHIADYLHPKDLFNFSYSCKRVFVICDGDCKIWARALQHETSEFQRNFRYFAESIVEKQILFATKNVDKLAFLMYRKTKRNWIIGESVSISASTTRGKDAWTFYKNSSMNDIFLTEETFSDSRYTLKFGIWSVETGKVTNFVLEHDVTNHKGGYFIFHFNDFLVATVSMKYFVDRTFLQHTRYKINMAEAKLEPVWRIDPTYGGNFICHRIVTERLLVHFVDLSRENHTITIQVEGFSMADSSKVFSIPFSGVTCNQSMAFKDDADGWAVLRLAPKLYAFNYKTTEMFVLRDDCPCLKQLIFMGGKALCHYENGDIELHNVAAGVYLGSFELGMSLAAYHNRYDVNQSTIYFNPSTDSIKLLLKIKTKEGKKKKGFEVIHFADWISPPTVKYFRYKLVRDVKMVLDNFVILKIVTWTKFSLIVTNANDKKTRICQKRI